MSDVASELIVIVGPEGGGAGDSAAVEDAHEAGIACDATTSIVCSGSCVDKETDPANCNTCGTKCPGPDSGSGQGICVNAGCQISCVSDAGTTLFCPTTGDCVDPTGIANCGGCGTVCPAPMANGAASCTGSPLACGFACTTGNHPSGGGAACNVTCASNSDDPATDPCVVADGLGVFVSAAGSDTSPGNGSKEHPYATIGYAMGQAATGVKRVYACGAFTAPLAVVAADDGVTVYGGFNCSTGAYSAATPTTVAPTAAGYALQVTGLTTGVTFEDFAFTAVSASSTPSATPASSIAVFVNASPLTLTRVAVTAGSGQPGVGGGQVANWSGAAPGGSGPATLTSGGAGGGPNACTDGTTSMGGAGGSVPGTALQGTPGANNAGLSGTASCTPGTVGTPGSSDTSQAAGANAAGSLTSTGWVVGGPGSNGGNGGVGQGGGGGGSNASGNGGAGGGGGAGGCGGGKGIGGGSAGVSVGVMSFDSVLVLSSATIQTGAGGGGGNGGQGQAGQIAGGGAAGGGSGDCSSGMGGGAGAGGGNGGGGGGGGGGAGGPSSGIAWKGSTPPSFNGASISSQATVTGITLGTQGSGGSGTGPIPGGSGATPTPMAVFQSP